ncbi:hypothetical protein DRH29_02705 [candidate division Kazan bacterium]|uniref:Uncharacterized protein n=1 Tax=candidate division Kazan bacterium TaxID=2202143 RepID=A0A420ZCI1_UNCK3|nr:MAG: hypothetical protein DRH29_02705 [candidate division Kazan bacterium]
MPLSSFIFCQREKDAVFPSKTNKRCDKMEQEKDPLANIKRDNIFIHYVALRNQQKWIRMIHEFDLYKYPKVKTKHVLTSWIRQILILIRILNKI